LSRNSEILLGKDKLQGNTFLGLAPHNYDFLKMHFRNKTMIYGILKISRKKLKFSPNCSKFPSLVISINFDISRK
jgi:hypothetical protein